MTTTPNPTMPPQDFMIKWANTRFGERQAAQEWFTDLCRLVGHPTPAERNDPENYTFEKSVPGGFADAYLANHFAWEFKKRAFQLPGAFNQLLRYQVYLRTPPLLITSSFQLIRIQTNFPGKETVVHEIPIGQLWKQEQLQRLSNIFFAPHEFEPDRTPENVTEETAQLFRDVVEEMERRDVASEELAKYLNQIIFCLYAEDTDLLPTNKFFEEIIATHWGNPRHFNIFIQDLFEAMRDGTRFGAQFIRHFNGDLFNGVKPVYLSEPALLNLRTAVGKSWRNIEPSVFGTLFEGALDASKRSQLGAHYTSADDIMAVIEPVLMKPLRQEWQAAKAQADALLSQDNRDAALDALDKFRDRLTSVTVLDPACGSGNFLYIALRALLDLEKEVIDYAAERGQHDWTPRVSPAQIRGLEIDHYAAELARNAIWIGYIQWHQTNGFGYTRDPVLMPLDIVQRTDAILTYDADGNPLEPDWPDAEFIVGNPPFLGHLPFRESLGDEYVDALYSLYGDRIPNSSDLCCYWLEKARAQIAAGKAKRAGLLATQAIRFQSNRPVLSRIKETGDIFMAISDKEWVLDGANVHISIIGFDDGGDTDRMLDGEPVENINADLSTGGDITQAQRLAENSNLSFMGDIKVGPFEIAADVAERMLAQPNPHGKPNSDVINRWMNGRDLNQRSRGLWIIDFGNDMSEEDAALYETPFEYVLENVKPTRDRNRDARFRNKWWLHGRPRIEMREALSGLPRYIGTSMVSKHRIFAFIDGDVLPDATIIVFARDDDYFFGVLQSRPHTLWASELGTQLENRPRYTPTTCFETFPFPNPDAAQRAAIAAAARRLHELRHNWLNPAETDLLGNPVVAETERRRRTLTALYNANPAWLQNAHAALDHAVARAYGWPPDLPDRRILANLLALNARRHAQEQAQDASV